MRGKFNNDQDHLDNLGPNRLSTESVGRRIANGLEHWTGRPWVVSLNMNETGPAPGGFHIEPPEDRLRKGKMGPRDWSYLVELFGAVAEPMARRYYILPDEISHVLGVLEHSGPVKRPKSKKLDELDAMLADQS